MSDYSDLEVAPEVVLVRGLLETDRAFAEEIEPAQAVDAERFKSAMRAFATGVVIVSVEAEDGRLLGLTINSCCSISARPPQVLISLAHGASCREPLLRRGRFGLSILGEQHLELAELGAVPGGPKHVDVFAERVGDRPATIAGALAHLDCAVARTFEVSDHTLVIGTVEHALVGEDGAPPTDPLVYFDRTFRRLGPPLERTTESEGTG
jgi:flavin reductase (DIM6/NTAB) family NADH-FMN oxidoreductase RutF